jgi:formamidopyrimidine-DNA glycosylase
MPEYPDIIIYIEHINRLLIGKTLLTVRIKSPFLLRTYEPSIYSIKGKKIVNCERIGKQIIFELTGKFYLVFHLMIAGRLHWKEKNAKIPIKNGLAAFDFEDGTLILTESGTKKRASLYLVEEKEKLKQFDKGGIDIFSITFEEFKKIIQLENHRIKRCLTDQKLISGIGNAYSDEILHHAKLSPLLQSKKMTDQEIKTLLSSSRSTLEKWVHILRDETKDKFPEKVTAFRSQMAVHGKFKEKCPVCSDIILRIRYSSNETNYCPTCQTNGRKLADRSLSRLLK